MTIATIEPKPKTPAKRDRAGRPTRAQETQNRYEAERLAAKLAAQADRDAKRAQPLLPDTKISLIVAVALVGLLMVSSFTVSFAGIYQVAAYTGLPTYLQWLPALFIDAAILAYTVSLIIFKSRGASTWRTFAGLAGFAALSVGANVVHTVAYWDGDLGDYRAWVGVVITAAAPIAVLLASEEIGRLAFVEPGE